MEKNKAAFTIKELRAVVNDTIAVMHEPDKSTLRSTLNLQTPITKFESGAANSTPMTPQETPQQNNQQRRGRGRGRFRGRGAGRGGSARANLGANKCCRMCDGEQAKDHMSYLCPIYTTAEARREKLKAKNLCPACSNSKHTGLQCPEWVSCRDKNHLGQRHLKWLCLGNPHPGAED